MKSMFSFMKGNILVLTVSQIAMFFSMRMAMPYFSLYVLELGGTPAEIGLVTSFRALASLFIYPIAGQLADNVGRVKMIGLSRIFAFSMYLFYIFAPNWLALASGSFCLGLIIFHLPAQSALTADSLPSEQRGVGYATLTAVPGAIAIFAPYTGAYITTTYGVNAGMRYLYTVILVSGIVIAFIYLRFLKETLKEPKSKIHLKNIPSLIKESYIGVWETLKWMPKSLKALALIMMVSLFFNSIAGPFWIIYAVDVIKLTTLEWGLIMLFMGGFRIGLALPAGIIVDKLGKRKALIAALTLSVLPVFLFVFCRTFLHTLLVLLMTSVANSFIMPTCSALVADFVPREKRGRVMATLGRGMLFIMVGGGGGGGGPGMGTLLTIPMILASLLSGYIYSFNSTYPWLLLTLGFILCLILTVTMVKEPKKAEL